MQVLEKPTLKAIKRIPESMRGSHPFSAYAFWTFYALGDPDHECLHCKQYENKTFSGNMLRTIFPDLIFEDPDIYPNVHMTLWGVDTCKCTLIREDLTEANPEDLVFYTGE